MQMHPPRTKRWARMTLLLHLCLSPLAHAFRRLECFDARCSSTGAETRRRQPRRPSRDTRSCSAQRRSRSTGGARVHRGRDPVGGVQPPARPRTRLILPRQPRFLVLRAQSRPASTCRAVQSCLPGHLLLTACALLRAPGCGGIIYDLQGSAPAGCMAARRRPGHGRAADRAAAPAAWWVLVAREGPWASSATSWRGWGCPQDRREVTGS